jgi:serine/threonine protein kinase
VYSARDTKLKREVAIKILPDEFSRDPERVGRFQREAEALAALNHQNIGAIYDLQQADDTRFLVLELVEGDTLEELLAKRGALSVEVALNIAKSVNRHDRWHAIGDLRLEIGAILADPHGLILRTAPAFARPSWWKWVTAIAVTAVLVANRGC